MCEQFAKTRYVTRLHRESEDTTDQHTTHLVINVLLAFLCCTYK